MLTNDETSNTFPDFSAPQMVYQVPNISEINKILFSNIAKKFFHLVLAGKYFKGKIL